MRVTDRDAQSFGGVYLVEPRTRRRTSSAGIAFFDYLGVALSAFDDSLRKLGRTERSNQLVTQTPLPVILVGSVVYPFVLLSLRTAVYLGWGIAVFGFPAGQGNWPAAAMVLAASVLAFVGLGVLSASCSLVFKRG